MITKKDFLYTLEGYDAAHCKERYEMTVPIMDLSSSFVTARSIVRNMHSLAGRMICEYYFTVKENQLTELTEMLEELGFKVRICRPVEEDGRHTVVYGNYEFEAPSKDKCIILVSFPVDERKGGLSDVSDNT